MLFHIKVASFLRIVPFEISLPLYYFVCKTVCWTTQQIVCTYVVYFLGHNLNMYSFAPGHFRISRILLNKNALEVLWSTLFLSTFSAISIMNNYNYFWCPKKSWKIFGRIGWNIFSKGILITRRNREFLNCLEAVLKGYFQFQKIFPNKI